LIVEGSLLLGGVDIAGGDLELDDGSTLILQGANNTLNRPGFAGDSNV
jgi:hypothetical protein